MRIIIDRDAVCAADDEVWHREEFIVPDDISIVGLFEFLEFGTFQSSREITWSGRSIITTVS